LLEILPALSQISQVLSSCTQEGTLFTSKHLHLLNQTAHSATFTGACWNGQNYDVKMTWRHWSFITTFVKY